MIQPTEDCARCNPFVAMATTAAGVAATVEVRSYSRYSCDSSCEAVMYMPGKRCSK